MGTKAIGTSLFLPGGPSLRALSAEGADVSAFVLQSELDLEKGLEMRKWVLSGILASEETYLSHLEALLLVRRPLLGFPPDLIPGIRASLGAGRCRLETLTAKFLSFN